MEIFCGGSFWLRWNVADVREGYASFGGEFKPLVGTEKKLRSHGRFELVDTARDG